jgi:hypothetical protein
MDMRKLACVERITLADRAHALQQERMRREIPKLSILATTKFLAAA